MTIKSKIGGEKMKHKYTKKLIDIKELADFFGMEKVDIGKHFAKGNRLDYIYIVLNRDDLTTREKKTYLYKTSMSEAFKDNIWQRFSGDYWFAYCRGKSKSLEFRI